MYQRVFKIVEVYIRNKIGPRMDPCGTPFVMVCDVFLTLILLAVKGLSFAIFFPRNIWRQISLNFLLKMATPSWLFIYLFTIIVYQG